MGKLSDQILAGLKNKSPAGDAPSPSKSPPVPFSSAAKAEPDSAEGGDEYGGDEVSIAGDLKQALDEGDDAAVADALKSFIEACYPQLAKE